MNCCAFDYEQQPGQLQSALKCSCLRMGQRQSGAVLLTRNIYDDELLLMFCIAKDGSLGNGIHLICVS